MAAVQASCLHSQFGRLLLSASFIYWKAALDVGFQLLYPQLPAQQQTVGNRFGHQVYCGKHPQNILFGHSVTGPVLHSPKLETLGNAQWDQILPFWTQTLVNTEGHRRNLSHKHD